MDVTELSKRFAMLKAQKEYHEKMASVLGTDIAAIGKQLYEAFADTGTKQIRIGGDIFVDRRERIVKPELKFAGTIVNEANFFVHLRATNFGALIKETIHHKTLETWIKKQKTGNLPLPSEDILKVWTVETAKSTRAPQRADASDTTPAPEPTEIEGEEPE